MRMSGEFMKTWCAVAAVALLAPGMARADEPAPQPAPAPAAAPASAPAATATASAEPAKKDEKKEEKKEETAPQNASLMTPEQLAALGKWTFNLGMDNIVGSGTFVNAEYFGYAGTALSVSWTKPLRFAGRNFLFNGGTGMTVEYSRPDALNGRRLGWSDIRVGLAMPGAYRDALTGISINPAISATVPITLESWGTGTITNLTAGVRAIRRFGPIDLRLGATGGYTVNTSPYVRQYASVGPDNVATALCRVSDVSCGTGGLTNKFTLGTNLVALWFFNDDLLFYGTLGWNLRWRNAATMEVDEFTPKAVDVNGNPVAQVGLRPTDVVSGSVGFNYNLTDVFSISFTLSNDGPPKTFDNKALRNPFLDLVSPANNFTNYTLSLYATL
jgi:hypothetical protein